jgi:DNA invertase Pin-like site-specific DNA recombinase/aspartate carbamoyltransferase regulatory subunit
MINLEGLPGVLYSRKSRKDVEAEREAAAQGRPFDTLEKHREQLLRMARQHKVHVLDILEEVVSGEFIAERPKMQKVFEYLASGKIQWVGVVDEDRLGRGDKIDQGRIERAFKESGAYILTPNKIVDMQDEADELYMDYKGMGARYEYKQTKKRLHGGRRNSAARGNYVGARPPFGYLRGIDYKTEHPHLIKKFVDKASDMENLKLYPHPEEAEVVKNIFKWFIDGVRISEIEIRLNAGTIRLQGSKDWKYRNIHRILKNPVYKGDMVFGKRTYIKLETGKYKVINTSEDKVQVKEKAHIPLITDEEFEAAQERITKKHNPKVNVSKKLVNPLATLLKCHYCGSRMSYRIYYHDPTTRNPFIICNRLSCKKNHSIGYRYVEAELLRQIEKYYNSVLNNPDLAENQHHLDPLDSLEKRLISLNKKLADAKEQLNTAHEYLELKVYSIETFIERQKVINEKIKQLQDNIITVSNEIDKEKIKKKTKQQLLPKVRNVLDAFDAAQTAEEKNALFKTIIETIYYEKPGKGVKKNPHFNLRIIWRDI